MDQSFEKGFLFGLNGMEREDEIYGDGNAYLADYWAYDARLGRRWNVDPVVKAWESGYATFSDNPIYYVDPNGDDPTPGEGDPTKKGETIVTDDGKEVTASTDEALVVAPKPTQPQPSTVEQVVSNNLRCHPGNKLQEEELNRIQAEYQKLDHKGGQVNFPRSPIWDAMFGKREYAGMQVNSEGYLTGQMSPQTGSPDLVGGTGIIKGGAGIANRYHHVFGKAEHALGPLITKFGSQEAAFNAVQKAANEALHAEQLTSGANGVLPTGDLGHIINVEGMSVRLMGGKIENNQVIISSFSRKGL